MSYKVIDVSYHQGSIDFKKVKADGVVGVILRIGYTGYGTAKQKKADPNFEQYYVDAKAAGLNVGGYWYSCAYTVAEAEEEAEMVLKLIKGKKFEYPIYWDTEDVHDTSKAGNAPKNQRTIGKTLLTDCAVAFCEKLEAAGYWVGIYASKSWFLAQLEHARIKPYAQWVAHYTTSAHPEYAASYGMWQYSSTGRVSGIKGNVDMNYCYVDYPKLIKAKGLNNYCNAAPPDEVQGGSDEASAAKAKVAELEAKLAQIKALLG